MEGKPTLPASLRDADEEELEEYVRSRIRSFARRFAQGINPLADAKAVEEVLEKVLEDELPSRNERDALVKQEETSRRQKKLHFEFFHVCNCIGCRNNECQLCRNNPDLSCEKDFASSYYVGVGGKFTSACGASISIRVMEDESGKAIDLEEDLLIELWAVEGSYQGRSLDAHIARGDDGIESFMMMGKLPQPISLIIPSNVGFVDIPRTLVFTRSTEKLDSKSARLCVRTSQGQSLEVKEARSEIFRVLTTRSRLSCKPERPNAESSVKNLLNVGGKTFEKLQNLQEEAQKQHLNLDLASMGIGPGISTIRDFQTLSHSVEKEPALKEKLLKLLGMTEESWEKAVGHAFSAVVQDNIDRCWICEDVALVYGCTLGKVDLDSPKQVWYEDKVYDYHSLEESERSRWQVYHRTARDFWFQEGHPGWIRMDQKSSEQATSSETEHISYSQLFEDASLDFVEGLLEGLDVSEG